MNDRRFNDQQRVAFYLVQNGRCALCGTDLTSGWHADHVVPWSLGGETDVINGQALCPTCNLKKGNKMESKASETPGKGKKPREWQMRAWDQYTRDGKKDWLLCATPGAGKTTWSLGLARRLLDNGTIGRVVVVAPTQTIRDQWKDQTIVHLEAVENRDGGIENRKDFEGIVLTYQQVAAQPDLQRIGCSRAGTLVIFDEIHHAGFPNQSWGDQAKYAFKESIRRISLTGTPWRRPGYGKIAFVEYDEEGKLVVDFAYEYGEAVRDGVCRSVEFRAYDGTVKYVSLESCVPYTYVYSLEDEDDKTPVLRNLLNPSGPWIKSMLQMAHTELLNIRGGNDGEGAIPDAKGLVIADNQIDARAIGDLLGKLTKEKPEVIISDEGDAAKEALDRFKNGTGLWAVAVNQVSEGVDVPALYVGVYATRKKTPLIFRQIIGRFVRRRVDAEGYPRSEEDRSAVVFMPAVPALQDLASLMESELRHELDLEIEEGEKELKEAHGDLGDELGEGESTEVIADISLPDLKAVIEGGAIYSREEYDNAQSLATKHGIPSAYIVNVAAMMRESLVKSPLPSVRQDVEEKETPRSKIKKALKNKIEKEARKKALGLGVEYKEFNSGLIRLFGGTRQSLSIDKLKELLSYLEHLKINEQGDV